MVLFPPPFYFVFYISNLLSYIHNNFSYELARPIMGTIFLVYYILLASEQSERDTLRSVQLRIADIYIIGERAKRARHSQVCSIENRGYIY